MAAFFSAALVKLCRGKRGALLLSYGLSFILNIILFFLPPENASSTLVLVLLFGTGIFNTIDGVIGTGNGIQIFPAEYGALVLTLPIGGFITLGCLIALMQYALRKSAEKKEAKEKALAAQEKEAA